MRVYLAGLPGHCCGSEYRAVFRTEAQARAYVEAYYRDGLCDTLSTLGWMPIAEYAGRYLDGVAPGAYTLGPDGEPVTYAVLMADDEPVHDHEIAIAILTEE